MKAPAFVEPGLASHAPPSHAAPSHAALVPADPVARVQAAQRQLLAHRRRVDALTSASATAGEARHPWMGSLARQWDGVRHKLDAVWAVQRGQWGDAAAAGLAHSASQRPYLTVAVAAVAGGLLAWSAPRLWRWWLLPLIFAEGRAWLNRHTVNTFSTWVERTRAARAANRGPARTQSSDHAER